MISSSSNEKINEMLLNLKLVQAVLAKKEGKQIYFSNSHSFTVKIRARITASAAPRNILKYIFVLNLILIVIL